MTNGQIVLIISASAVLILLTAILAASYATYRITFMRRRRDYDPYFGLEGEKYKEHMGFLSKIIDSIAEEPYETLYITAKDGTRLAGRYYHRRDGAPLHVICHGYKSSPLRDGSGGGCDSRDMGHNLLLIYQRAHGESEGRTISFGIRERYDILDWLNYMTERCGKDLEIILIGTSMGAASVLMASELDLPESVKCIIADCPYSSPKEILMKSAAEMGYPPRAVYPLIRLGARIFGGFDPSSASVTEAVRGSRVPILIAHGKADSMVPYEMSERIAASALDAGRDCTLALFEGAEHCMSFITDYEGYTGIRNKFLEANLKGFGKATEE